MNKDYDIDELILEFQNNKNKDITGNKAAGRRARKLSLIIEKELKKFRKESMERSKIKKRK